MHLTPAYGHRLADVHSGGFAPAFTLSFHDSECSRKPPNAHSLGRWQQAEKKMKKQQRHGENEPWWKKTEKNMKENQPFTKLKEVFLQRTKSTLKHHI